MNRRAFLLNQPLIYSFDKPVGKVIPVNTKQINSNDTIFISENGRLKIQSIYDDYGVCVAVTNAIEWEDPITDTPMKKLVRDLYILEKDEM